MRKKGNGNWVAFLCESSDEWYCPVCRRYYHSYTSLTQHLRRSHDVVSFALTCVQCRELFSNQRSYKNHVGNCPGEVARGRTHACPSCGEEFRLPDSLTVHKTYCARVAAETGGSQPMSGDGGEQPMEAKQTLICQYCDKEWSNKKSLSQHIRNQHMAESQQDRLDQLSKEPQGLPKTGLDGGAKACLPERCRPSWVVKPFCDSLTSRPDHPADPEL